MNCGIAPDVSFFYSSLVPYLPRVCLSLLAAGSHKFCSQCWPRRVTLPASLLCTASRASLDPSPGIQAAPTPGFILVLFWFSCLKALAGQTGVWSWSLSHPGLAVPARVVVGQRGIVPLCPTARGRHLTPSRHHFGRGDQLSGTAIRPASARGTAR